MDPIMAPPPRHQDVSQGVAEAARSGLVLVILQDTVVLDALEREMPSCLGLTTTKR